MLTHDLSDQTARYLIRGYFSGDGQHWTAIWDQETGSYFQYHAGKLALFRSGTEAEDFLRHHGYVA